MKKFIKNKRQNFIWTSIVYYKAHKRELYQTILLCLMAILICWGIALLALSKYP